MSNRSIVHYDIPSKDLETSKQFYSDLFGWQFHSAPMPGGDGEYTMISDGGIGGGFVDLSEHIKPGDVLIYISSEDIAADLQKVEELGGQVAMPLTPIPGFGELAMFIDPTGNRLALWKDTSQG